MYSQVTLATVFAGVAAAMDWNIIAERQPGGPGTEILTDRINYGDGTLYLASEKPADVDLWLDDVMLRDFNTGADFLARLSDSSQPDALPTDTYLYINNGTDANDRVQFTDDPESLGEGYIADFLRYGTILIPRSQDGTSTPTEWHFWLEPVGDVDEQFAVRWVTNDVAVEENWQPVTLHLRR